MADKDARSTPRAAPNWKLWLSCLLAVAVISGAVVAARSLWRPGQASAQAARPQTNSPPAQNAQASGPIALLAIVNGQQISREYLARECLIRYGKDVLETAVNRQLILEECKHRGITVTQQEIDDDISHKAKMFGLTTDSYLTLLERERNIDPRQYGRDIIWPTLAMRKLVAAQIQVGDDEIQKAFETEIGPQVKVRLIVAKDRQTAERIRQQAVADPESFGALAKDHSSDETSASGRGWIPPIRRHAGDPLMERTAFAMREGEISPVLEVKQQFVILKCEGHVAGTDPRTLPPEQHAAFKQRIVEHLSDVKMRQAAAGMFDQLQQRAQVKIVYDDQHLQPQMPDVAALINGRQILLGELAEDCIARHGIEVLDGEINRAILTQELKRRNLAVTQADVEAEVARAAESYGYPTVEEWLKTVEEQDGVTRGIYYRDAVWPSVALKKLVSGQVEVTSDDMQKAFVANYGERVEALAIVLSNMRQAQQVWEMARNTPTDQFFGELAHQYSIEPVSRANYGRIPPIAQYAGQTMLETEAFKLQAGELSSIIAAEDKFVILRCQGRTKPEVQRFDDVRDELSKDILEKKTRLKMAQEFDRLKETAQIDNFLAGTSQSGKQQPPAIGKNSPPGAQPPQVPAGRIGGRVPFGPGTLPQRR
jgi:parvulin-like peptidyl-prolyl isomerase